MGCASSVPRKSVHQIEEKKRPSKDKDNRVKGERSDTSETESDPYVLHTTAAPPLILGSKTPMMSTEMSLDGFQIRDSPSFFNPLEKPTIFEYEFQQHIGHGSASDVFLVKNQETGIMYAAKVYDQDYLYRMSIGESVPPIEKVSREIQLMSEINHPNIVPLIEILDDQPTHSLIIILPFAEKGSLSKSSWKADPLPEAEAKNTFRQIASALQYLHSLDIIHRDLKPENILCFADGHSAISDFSVSLKLEDPNEMLEDTEGTPVFYSPEQCSGEPYLGKPADCWAFGIVLYLMIFGKLPFFEADDEEIYRTHFFHISQVISTEELTYPDTSNLSNELVDLFHHILDRNPATRYNMDQICSHKWFSYDE
ncbi:CAMK family protein kinase [Trichomonas vaginalis G3]|uniref:CAMK family protein kinase n=1 Tax=Trichomonas vaginalis (strain ATCC PRA-98 / G3) TaxID=412133 RepID=A2F0R6_TRIV3|nr:peptidyl-threonine phosphorylation [Trichomonas vaginalis G3]EAY01511.1 CAMK family protein kinase [Trichomonas vaginalis G3]KAI5482185.1 peptidyl-threonine phosphorylation [Trichomonas vaginalis G3]|eukprot:XP_001314196.1 CAMK family protein kinase [Trichomonas vaginalis G3]